MPTLADGRDLSAALMSGLTLPADCPFESLGHAMIAQVRDTNRWTEAEARAFGELHFGAAAVESGAAASLAPSMFGISQPGTADR
jgi:hypothetical protein